MSIASRITSIEGHIGDIYDTLELGGDTTQNKNLVNINTEIKREYKDFLANGTDTLWNNWEKVSGSGTSIFLNNTIQAPMKTNLNGNTSQNGTPTPSSPVEVKTTTGRQEIDVRGKNLLPFPYFTTSSPFTNNGITYTINNDGTINVNGTATGRSSIPLYGNYLVANQKDLTGRYIKGGTSNVNMYVFAHIGNQYPVLAQDTGQGAEIDKSTYQKGYIELVVTNGTTVNNELIKPMMLNSLDDTTYEEYKLQSYEINLGKNLLDVSSFPQNSYVSGGITTLIEGQMLSCSGTATSTSFNIGSSTVTFNLKLKNNTTYTISRTNAISERLYIRLYNSDKTQNQDVQIVANSKSTTFTTTFDVNSCYLFMVGHSSGSVLNIESFGVQIEKGSQASQYSLYKTPIELCKIGTYQDRILKNSGKNLFNKEDVVDGYYINDYGEFVQRSDLFYSNFISVKPNTKYVNSGKSNWTVTALYNANKEFISRPTYNAITTTNETYYIRVIGLVSEKDRIMLEEGSTPTLYEPFGSGKWYLEKKIGKVVLNGSETGAGGWALYNHVFFLAQINDYKNSDNIPYCNYYKGVVNVQGTANMVNKTIAFNFNHTDLPRLFIRDDDIASVTDFINWLSTHNTEVYYVLAAPTTTEITDYELINQLNELEKAKSLENQTNISQTADLPFELDIVALKGE